VRERTVERNSTLDPHRVKIGGRRVHICLVNTHTHNVVLVGTHINIIK